eukprot:8296674-Pyramimonas_sp.AAC.1
MPPIPAPAAPAPPPLPLRLPRGRDGVPWDNWRLGHYGYLVYDASSDSMGAHCVCGHGVCRVNKVSAPPPSFVPPSPISSSSSYRPLSRIRPPRSSS